VHPLANFITDFGDSAVTVPLAGLTALALAAGRQWRLMLAWLVAVGLTAVLVAGLKIVLAACAWRFAIPGLHNPSGHAAMSAAVYGGLALLVGGRQPWLRLAVELAAAAVAVAIALSRVVLHAHSPLDAASGLAIGLAIWAGFRYASAGERPAPTPAHWLAAAAVLVIALAHGARWHTEQAIHLLAGLAFVRLLLPWCG
jgi:membrane-associated phospholipid phosphatase